MVTEKQKTIGRWVALVVGLILAFFIGWFVSGGGAAHQTHGDGGGDMAAAETVWTCPMHPQIRLPEFGPCPICGMDLIPAADDADAGALGERQLRLSPRARELAAVQVTPVQRMLVERSVTMAGRVSIDETRQASITARVAGRLDRLYVDYTGITVNKGDHLVELYSPDVLAAQEELLQAKKGAAELKDSHLPAVRKAAERTLQASRDKLLLWGLSQDQVDAIEALGRPVDQIQINAPIGGVVTQKMAREGDYVKVGTPIYQIADLSSVWVLLDAYEEDLPWLRYGQKVDFTVRARPGETFEGRIAFIDPLLDGRTRTVKVRVNVPNTDRLLKPGMFVTAQTYATVAAGGHVVDATLAGKFVCPMHPEVISDDADATCSVCGMDLVSAESLGFVADEPVAALPLVIPTSAALVTGKRAVVYVQAADDAGLFEGRDVVLGERAGDRYIVESGLREGELVVTNGAFKIDSEMQIRSKPSMMNPAHDEHAGMMDMDQTMLLESLPAAFHQGLAGLFGRYLELQTALANDDLAAAKTAAKAVNNALWSVDAAGLTPPATAAWNRQGDAIDTASSTISEAADIQAARVAFEPLSMALIAVAAELGTGLETPLQQAYCPMAFTDAEGKYREADWLQQGEEIRNPYWGAEMLECGDTRRPLGPAPSQPVPAGAMGAGGPSRAAPADGSHGMEGSH